MTVQSPPPPVPVSLLRAATDRFFCAPYKLTMMAKGCVERQALIRAGSRNLDFSKCVGCGLGKQVEDSVGPASAESAARGKPARLAALPTQAHAVIAEAAPVDAVHVADSEPSEASPKPRCSVDGCTTKLRLVRIDGVMVPPADGLCGFHRQAGPAKHQLRARRDDGAVSSLRIRDPGSGQVWRKGNRWYAKEPERFIDGKRFARYIGSFDTPDQAHAACDEWVDKNGGPKIDHAMPTCTVPGCATKLNERSLVAGDGICGVHRASGWRGKLTTTTTHAQSVELELGLEPQPQPATPMLPPADAMAAVDRMGKAAADSYRALREERAAIATRSAELDERIRRLAPLACLSDPTLRPPTDPPLDVYSHKRTRHFDVQLLADMEELRRVIIQADAAGKDCPAEWDEYIELLNSFDPDLIFYAGIGLQHCATMRNGLLMASFLWCALELLHQLGPCGAAEIATAASEGDDRALQWLTELERRGLAARHRPGGFHVTPSGKVALESPKPSKAKGAA